MVTTRRGCLTGAAAAVTMAALARSDPTRAQPKAVRIGAISTVFDYAPVWMAQANGLFEAEGVPATYTVTGSVPRTLDGLLNDTFDLAVTVPEGVVAAINKGAPLRIVGGITGKVAASLIAAPSIRTVADLKGKRLGVSGLQEGTGLLIREMVKQHGLQPSDVELSVVGVGGDRWRALQEGRIEAGLQTVPLNFIAEEQGYVNLGDAPDVLPPYQFLVIAARMPWLEANAAAMSGSLRALLRGLDRVYADKAEATRLAVENMKVSPEHARRTWDFFDRHRPHDPNLAVNPGSFATTLRTMGAAGLITAQQAAEPANYIDQSLLTAVRRQMGR
jgi:ABC-type nitrate/sulfonate/bicarbonate transport system substrate-binding protein